MVRSAPQLEDQSVQCFVDAVLDRHSYAKNKVVAVLQDVQRQYRYIPREVLLYVASRMKLSPAKVYGIATFYENFSLEAKGHYVIKMCDGTACHVRGSMAVEQALRQAIGLSEGERTSQDMLFTLETVACLGACSLAPVLTVNDEVHASMTPETVRDLIIRLRLEAEDHD